MRGFSSWLRLGIGVAASAGAAAAFALASPLSASAAVSGVTVYTISFSEFVTWNGVIATAGGSCDNHCSAVINWGDGTSTTIDDIRNNNGGVQTNDVHTGHTYFEEGPYPVSVTMQAWSCFIACSPGGASQTGALVETSADAALNATSNSSLTTAEGVNFNGTVGTFHDTNLSGGTLNDFGASIYWGDGSSSAGTITGGSGGDYSVAGQHTYRTAGRYGVSTHVADVSTSTDIPAAMQVNDVALTLGQQPDQWTAGVSATQVIASFKDQNPLAQAGDFSATIDWGDGTQSVGTVAAGNSGYFNVSGTHTYATAGSYNATTTVHDSGGSSATASSAENVQGQTLLPALSNGAYGGYQTTVYIQNTGSSPAGVGIFYFDQNGGIIGSDQYPGPLPPHATWAVSQNNGHAFPAGQAGSGIILSDQPVAAFVNEFPPGTTDATSYTGITYPQGSGTTLYAPAIANNAYGGYTTGIGLYGGAGTVTITYRDAFGVVAKVQTLSVSGGYTPIYSGDSGSPNDAKLPNNWAGTATITAAYPMAAIVNETGPNGQFSSYDAVNAGSKVLFAPTALNNAYGGFYTGMGIQNTSSTAGTVTVDYYDSTGAKTEKTQSIAANGYIGLWQGSPTDGPPANPLGYTAVISSDQPLAVIVNETAAPAGSLTTMSTSYNTFSQGRAQSNLPLVENVGPDGISTGLGIMNTGSAATTVTLSYFDANTGAPIGQSQTQVVQPKAFYGPYQPTAGMPPGTRGTAVVTTTAGGQVAVIANETGGNEFMSYDGE